MFQSSSNRLRAWLKLVDEVLDDVLGDSPVHAQPHPHRRPLRIEHQRRPGSVPARPACCLSPVRADRPESEPVR